MPDDGFEKEGVYTGTFLVEIDGLEVGRFVEVSGLEVEVGVEEVEEGGENGFVHKMPGRMSWPNLVLKRGLTQNDRLMAWLATVSGDGFAGQKNKLTRRSASVVLLSAGGKRLREWELDDAFPVKWKGPSFAASSTDMAFEELEIAHHGFTAKKP